MAAERKQLTLCAFPVEVLWNTVPIYMWGRKERRPEMEDIKKPVIVFNESPTHYSNEKRMKGDLDMTSVFYVHPMK